MCQLFSPCSNAVNLFFVTNHELGKPFPHTFADLVPNYDLATWKPLHGDCLYTMWVEVEDSPGLVNQRWLRYLNPVMLTHLRRGSCQRRFEIVEIGAALVLRPCPMQDHVHRRRHTCRNFTVPK